MSKIACVLYADRLSLCACLREAVSADAERRHSVSQESICRLVAVEQGARPVTCAVVMKGSGNVFRDLGFSDEKPVEPMLKNSLIQAPQKAIKD